MNSEFGDRPKRDDRHDDSVVSTSRSGGAPGRRIPTLGLPGPAPGGARPIQRQSDPAARAARSADTERWMDTAMRPDLYAAPVPRAVQATMEGPGAPVQRKEGDEAGDDTPPRPPRQLHVFVNLERIPSNRVQVFLQHFIGRLETSGGRGTALNIAQGEGGLETQDISNRAKLNVGEPEVKSKTKKSDAKGLANKVNNKHTAYRQRLDELDEEPGKYDEIVVIGVAHPDNKSKSKSDDLYGSYADVSGLKDIEGLSAHIQGIVAQNLAQGGHLRVQLCHAGAVKVASGQTFSESLVPPEKSEMTVSAPRSFSVIGDDGDFVDMTTNMGIFDQNKGRARSLLLGSIKGDEPVETVYEQRKAAFLAKLGAKQGAKITDFVFGNTRGGSKPLEPGGLGPDSVMGDSTLTGDLEPDSVMGDSKLPGTENLGPDSMISGLEQHPSGQVYPTFGLPDRENQILSFSEVAQWLDTAATSMPSRELLSWMDRVITHLDWQVAELEPDPYERQMFANQVTIYSGPSQAAFQTWKMYCQWLDLREKIEQRVSH